ncbi:hypothetical protein Tco_0351508 [Tanacetum coccineum]
MEKLSIIAAFPSTNTFPMLRGSQPLSIEALIEGITRTMVKLPFTLRFNTISYIFITGITHSKELLKDTIPLNYISARSWLRIQSHLTTFPPPQPTNLGQHPSAILIDLRRTPPPSLPSHLHHRCRRTATIVDAAPSSSPSFKISDYSVVMNDGVFVDKMRKKLNVEKQAHEEHIHSHLSLGLSISGLCLQRHGLSIIYGMVELGEVTAAIAAAVFVVVSGFFASAAFAVAIVHVLPSHFSLLDLFLYGGISSKFNELYTFGVFSSAFKIARPMLLAGDIWQGIEFSQSKPQARVAGLTRVTFSDVAEIEIVTLEEL